MKEKNSTKILSNERIIAIVASSLTIVYGITSLVTKKSFNKTNDTISLTDEKLDDSIFVKKRGYIYNVSVYVEISKDVRRNEVETQISTQVAYDLAKELGISTKSISVTIHAVIK